MQQSHRLTAIIEREGGGYMALCPELDIASQGDTLEGPNLIEALTLFFETADASEIGQRRHSDVFVSRVEVPVRLPLDALSPMNARGGSEPFSRLRFDNRWYTVGDEKKNRS